jgi:hypothetical protein
MVRRTSVVPYGEDMDMIVLNRLVESAFDIPKPGNHRLG